jgi:hypothetical protein
MEVERQALEAMFEERRATLISETTEAVFLMIHGGKLAPASVSRGTVIQFPNQIPEHARSREQEVAGP